MSEERVWDPFEDLRALKAEGMYVEFKAQKVLDSNGLLVSVESVDLDVKIEDGEVKERNKAIVYLSHIDEISYDVQDEIVEAIKGIGYKEVELRLAL